MSSYSNLQVQELSRRAAEAERDAVCAARERLLAQIEPFVHLALELARELTGCPVCATDQRHGGRCGPHLQQAMTLDRLAASIRACITARPDPLCL
jgi:hypothetical protein